MTGLIYFLFCISGSGAVMDLTLISNTGASSVSKFFLTCISGERDPEEIKLQIKRDNSIVQLALPTIYKTEQSRPQEIRVNEFHKLNKQGIFYCIAQKSQKRLTTVTLISNFEKEQFRPRQLTVTASPGDTVDLVMHVLAPQKRDVTWKFNGNFHYTTHWTEFMNNTATLQIENLTKSLEGVYSANYMGDSPLYGTYMRLIVRACRDKKWGPNCDQDCPNCLNGGVCHDNEGDCICPPGFMGTHCETACREGMFGQNCQESCRSEQNCRGLTFCLSDPFGCTCASGWHGAHCTGPCGKDTYGAGCKLHCKCKNNGVCNRFSGCQCPTGWRGRNCEKSDHAPQILDMASSLEWNRNSSPKILCSAKGTPLPSHTSIELRKTDSTILKASHTTMDSNKSTAQFEIPHLSLEHGGVWECRVATNGGQDTRKFNLTVKEPPCPMTSPTLLEKRSKQLIVNPEVNYKGDGPIISRKLLYKPMETEVSWSSIIVYGVEPITLMNLKPSTRYFVKLQLTRPGEGGEGPPGPEAVMETDCPEPTVRPEIDSSSQEGHNVTVRWSSPRSSDVATGFLVELYGPKDVKLANEQTLLNVHSTKFYNLEYYRDYQVIVRLINCGSLGPPSKPLSVRLNSLGPSPPRNVQASPISSNTVLLKWQPPEDPNGGIVKYIIEYLPVGQESLIPWVDTDDGNKTSKHVMELNSSTLYQFRVRAVSKVLGEWSKFVLASTYGDGSPSFPPTMQGVGGRPGKDDYQLLVAVVGSVTVTCVTILVALLGLFCIRKLVFSRRRTFTYQSGSGEETILQFNSGTLTLTRRPKPQPEPLTYPILEWEDIKFEDVIGEGNFGQVIKAMIKKDGNKMSAAIKMLKEFASENDHRDFAGELEVLCKLGQHPNIINLIGACENRGYLYIAIEYAPYGNLLDFLRKSRVLETDPAFAKEHCTASTLTSQQLLQFAVDVATGMHYLSDKQFIHRDLAARNVLVGENLMAKIADFGLSRGEEVYVKKTMGRLPVRWMAIESLNYSVYTSKSDVWSFGVLLWEIVSLGGTPYCGMTCAELYEKLPQGYRMEQPKNCDDEVYELMRQCWRDRPYERPPFTQISVQLNRMQEARKAYVNMALFENFTYAGIDATAEEA
ncbi:tyrosine-protein kinase receptor Tie-1 isoform X2 [Brienomyrus brachyistius]|uniref:tyrosine-protein kinase receptor Tie-1 isoform X2 n=1 Tax=Brienomyrus brachyistius TaxID=42636 RepID=UPI0020B19168|nr:tyrosine-protein kinase receptor Tie-1 isoform X2 [Brienomyrus brachyistius]